MRWDHEHPLSHALDEDALMLMVPNPIPVMLHCPTCRQPHVCEQVGCAPFAPADSFWALIHTCRCGRRWQPCAYPVRGVDALSGEVSERPERAELSHGRPERS